MDSRHPHVLLVSDDTASTDELSDQLGDFGLAVATAFSTSEAMRLALETPPDVALVDADLVGGEDLQAWFQHRYRTTVCYVVELDHAGAPPPWDDEDADDGLSISSEANMSELVSMLLSALANVRAARIRAGLA